MVKIKTTHVGSLPRSNELSDLLFKKDQKQKINLDVFDQIVNRDVNEVVKKQIDVGIDFISDGEGKIRENWVPIDIIHILKQIGIDILENIKN